MRINGEWLVDSGNRRLFFRGVNLSGNAKLPLTPYQPTRTREGYFDYKKVSFVGRPFPLSSAKSHFQRLKSWGFNFLRFCVTWEALEPHEPGKYDHEYMDYVVQVLKVAREVGFKAFIDPHQDCWSRFTGGSGAPGWTLEAAGMEMRNFEATEAASYHFNSIEREIRPMIWPTNYYKLGCLTMFTLFFAGNTFAKELFVDGMRIQDYLQKHYCDSFKELAVRIDAAGLHADGTVVGYETLNEPSQGFVGIPDLNVVPDQHALLNGLIPTPLEAFLLGVGIPQTVGEWSMTRLGPIKIGSHFLNEEKLSAWKSNCIWENHGIYDKESMKILKPDYFAKDPETGEPVEFQRDFWKPYVNNFASEIRKVVPSTLIFIQPLVMEAPPQWTKDDCDNIVYAPHWYDGLTMMMKKNLPWNFDVYADMRRTGSFRLSNLSIGYDSILRQYFSQVKLIKTEGKEMLNNCPILIGECGIPFDMDEKFAYASNDYSAQEFTFNNIFKALESQQLSYTLWNYCPDNTHEHGDHWNDEDCSIFSEETENADGCRASKAIIRPFAFKIAGDPIHTSFDMDTKKYTLKFVSDNSIKGDTEVFLPAFHYPSWSKCIVTADEGKVHYNEETRILHYSVDTHKTLCKLEISVEADSDCSVM